MKESKEEIKDRPRKVLNISIWVHSCDVVVNVRNSGIVVIGLVWLDLTAN